MTNAAPSISVLLPVFDAESTLETCLASLRRQSEPDWECILVDDGSTDGSAGIARRFAETDRRIRVFHRSRGGLVPTLNHGLEFCRGRWIARLDADDLMHRERFARQRALLERHPDWDGAGCHVRSFPRDALGPGTRSYERWLNGIGTPESVERNMWIECPLAHPTLMMKRETLLRLGYRDVGWPEDYDLLLRLLIEGGRVGVLSRRLYLWRDHETRLSRNSDTYSLERFAACKAAHLSRSFLASTSRYALWGYGGTGRVIRRALEPLGKRLVSIVELHPGRLGNRIHDASVIPPERVRGLRGTPLLVSVAGAEPRREIREFLDAAGFHESKDYVCTA